MRQLTLCIFISISIICGLSGCRAQAQYITQEQAMQAVRNFEGDQSLDFDKVEFDLDSTLRFGLDGSNYSLSKNSPIRGWSVDALSGEVSGASYTDRWPDQYQSQPYGSYSQSQCYDIALAYARTKYSGFDGMGFQLKTSEWVENGWEFHWIQKIVYDAETFNDVTVSINPSTGQVMAYNSCKVPVTMPSAPTVSSQQAIDIARQHVGIVQNLDVHTSPRLFAYPDGTLEWSMEISGTSTLGSDVAYGISVNAGTGAVIDAEQASYVGPIKPKGQKNINRITDMLEKCTSISISNRAHPGKLQKIKQNSKSFTGIVKTVQSLLKSSKEITEKSSSSRTAKYDIRFYTGKDKAIEAKFDPGTGYFAITSQITLENKNGKERVASTEPIPAVITKCPKEFVEKISSVIQSAGSSTVKPVSKKK